MARQKMSDEDLERFNVDELPADEVLDDSTTATAEGAAPAAENPTEQTSAQKVMEAIADDDEEHINLSVSTVLGGDIFTGSWFRRQVGFFIMIIIMIILYITNRYTAQQSLIKIEELKDRLTEIRNESVTRSSQLLQRTRESKVVEYLNSIGDSTLTMSPTPPFVIDVKE